MDLDYRKKSSELVYDLINRDNPQLPVPVSPDNCKLGTPVVIPLDGIRNTRIAVMALDGGFYMGTASVTYRRLSQTDLFKQGRPIIEDFQTTSDVGPSGAGYVRIESALRWVNTRYGTNLQPNDADRVQVPNLVQNAAIFNFPANNPAWVGAFYWDRRAALKPVSEQVPETTPLLVTLAQGVASGGKPDNVADFMTCGADFTRFKDLLQTFTALTVLSDTLAIKELVKYMGVVAGRPFTSEVASSVANGFKGARIIRYALPNVNVPEANATDYNCVAVITPVTGSWFQGRFLLHYKV